MQGRTRNKKENGAIISRMIGDNSSYRYSAIILGIFWEGGLYLPWARNEVHAMGDGVLSCTYSSTCSYALHIFRVLFPVSRQDGNY
jgi:hypothetical protein